MEQVIYPRKNRHWAKANTNCPHCQSANITVTKHDPNRQVSKVKIFSSFSVIQIIDREILKCECEECHNKFVIDAGINEYTHYTTPNLDTDGSFIMEAECDFDDNFIIYHDSSLNRDYYYIFLYEKRPEKPLIFIEKSAVERFIDSPEKAMEFAKATPANRKGVTLLMELYSPSVNDVFYMYSDKLCDNKPVFYIISQNNSKCFFNPILLKNEQAEEILKEPRYIDKFIAYVLETRLNK